MLITNSAQRVLSRIFPNYFSASRKHDHHADFGWPEALSFDDFLRMYRRNSLASAAIDKTAAKTWETFPALWETEKPAETELETTIRRHFADRRIWQSILTTDRRAMVGCYAGAILLLADSKTLDQPVDAVPGAIEGLVGIVPAWEGQLTVAEWDSREDSPTFGEPLFFQFDEAAVGDRMHGKPGRQVKIHPDRVIIWSEDGTVNGQSVLEPGFNDLIDAEKIKGAGGEGFWKTSRGAPLIEAKDDMSIDQVMANLGAVTASEAMDKLNAQIADFQSGFDKGLMLGGMTAKPLQITLPQPDEFHNIPLQSFAASIGMPVRVLIGNQTGERATTEDTKEWARTCMARRENICLPLLNELVRRLVAWRILPPKDWTIGWASLLDASPAELIERASKLSTINAQTLPNDDPAFLPDEIREAAGYEPLGLTRDQPNEDEVIDDA